MAVGQHDPRCDRFRHSNASCSCGALSSNERSLVERLRSRGWEDRQHRQLREAAANELERLHALEAEARKVVAWLDRTEASGAHYAGLARLVRP